MTKIEELKDNARVLNYLNERIVEFEAELDLLKKQKNDLETREIPALMDELGLDSMEADNLKLSVNDILTARAVDTVAAVRWLEGEGYDSIVRYRLDFGKGSNTKEVVSELRAKGLEFDEADEVHWSQLQKMVKTHIEGGGAYPPPEAIETKYIKRASVKEIK